MNRREYTILLDNIPIPSISTVSKILKISRVGIQNRLKLNNFYLKEYHNGKILIIKLFTYKDDYLRN
jgi:hypothetical protein